MVFLLSLLLLYILHRADTEFIKKKRNQIWERTGRAHFMPGGQDGVLSTGPWKGGWQRTSRSAQADKGRCRGPGTGPAQHVWGQIEN